MTLDEFALNIRGTANKHGYDSSTPFQAVVAGITVEHLPVNRLCLVSHDQPPLYADTTVAHIWIDQALRVWKSSNWHTPATPAWEQIHTYEDIFLDSTVNSGGSGATGLALPLSGGTMSGPVLLFRDPIAQNEAVTKSYVDGVVNLIAAGRLYIDRPVSTIADLRALDVSTVPDEQVIFVEEARKMYAYDLQATGLDDGSYIIVPASGIGRWIATVPNVFDGGILP